MFMLSKQIKVVTIGFLIVLLFSQMSFKDKSYKGKYIYRTNFGSIILELKKFHKFNTFATKCNRTKRYGKWKVEKENVILIYKEVDGLSSDTLSIERINSTIHSLGKFKKMSHWAESKCQD